MIAKKYYCNDCEDEPPYTGACELSLPQMAAKPKYCPISDDCVECSWIDMEGMPE